MLTAHGRSAFQVMEFRRQSSLPKGTQLMAEQGRESTPCTGLCSEHSVPIIRTLFRVQTNAVVHWSTKRQVGRGQCPQGGDICTGVRILGSCMHVFTLQTFIGRLHGVETLCCEFKNRFHLFKLRLFKSPSSHFHPLYVYNLTLLMVGQVV